MRKNIKKVIDAFERGVASKGDSKGSCSTDGQAIYSYRTKIAERLPNGLIWLTTLRHSATTSAQVNAISSTFGKWDGESWSYDRLVRCKSPEDLCAHGAEEAAADRLRNDGTVTVTEDHCWGNAQLMKACVAVGTVWR